LAECLVKLSGENGRMRITGSWEIVEGGTSYATDFDLIFRRVL
jgi:hypothetical protein